MLDQHHGNFSRQDTSSTRVDIIACEPHGHVNCTRRDRAFGSLTKVLAPQWQQAWFSIKGHIFGIRNRRRDSCKRGLGCGAKKRTRIRCSKEKNCWKEENGGTDDRRTGGKENKGYKVTVREETIGNFSWGIYLQKLRPEEELTNLRIAGLPDSSRYSGVGRTRTCL